MPAVPSFIIDPLWDQFAALIPTREVSHPWGCHRPRIADRIIFDKLVQVLVLGASYAKISDSTCSATTLRTRRDEWIEAGIFTQLEQLCLEYYDRIIGLDLENVSVDGCIVKAPCGGEVAGRSPVDRDKQGTKRSLLVDGNGIPLGCVIIGANRHDSPVVAADVGKARPVRVPSARGDHGTSGCWLRLEENPEPARRTRLRVGDQQKGRALAGRCPLGRRADEFLAQPGLQETVDLYRAPCPSRRGVHRPGERSHHHPPAHPASLDHPPLGHPTHPTTMTSIRAISKLVV